MTDSELPAPFPPSDESPASDEEKAEPPQDEHGPEEEIHDIEGDTPTGSQSAVEGTEDTP